jgi:hypothetical protein
MGKILPAIDDDLAGWIHAQPLFFVGTAPSGDTGHVNVSPKGGAGSFRVTGPHSFAYLDLVGSGVETVAHLRDNGRIVVMFCAFDGAPRIVRLHGTGRVVQQGDDGFAEAAGRVGDEPPVNLRSVIEVDVARVSSSCGFAVPLMRFERERDQLDRWAESKVRQHGLEAMTDYIAVNNMTSIDGLPGLDPVAAGPIDDERRDSLDSTGRKL